MIKINKKNIIIIIATVIIIITGAVYYLFINNQYNDFITNENVTNTLETKEGENSENSQKQKENKIIIHVAGYVKNPGIIELLENSRISDAIEKAGGLLEEADISEINLACILEDGIKIYIPSHNEVEEEKKMENNSSGEIKSKMPSNQNSSNGIVSNNTNNKSNTKVNINSASKEELEELPGIGPATAEKIINHRKENGKFNQIEDIKSVKGIGDSKFENIKEYICVK